MVQAGATVDDILKIFSLFLKKKYQEINFKKRIKKRLTEEGIVELVVQITNSGKILRQAVVGVPSITIDTVKAFRIRAS